MAHSAKINFERTSLTGSAIIRSKPFVENSMKRRVVLALPIAGLLLGVALAFGVIQRKSQPTTWSSGSPNKTYRVSFVGMSSPPSWPFTSEKELKSRKVSMTVSKDGTILVDNAEIYDGDAYDSSFSDLYPKTEWLSETTLHLWQEIRPQRASGINIRNESGQEVRYLYIKAGKTNLFFLFNIPPGKSETFPVQLEHWEAFVGCKGKFEDHDFAYRSIDFSSSPVPSATIHFNVTVTKDGCSVSGKV